MTTAHRGLTGIACLVWALQGCFNPSPPVGVECAFDGWCPSGQRCDVFTWECYPGSDDGDAGVPWNDAGWPWPPDDAFMPEPDAAAPQTGIDAALMSFGPVNIDIPQVLVTYVKPGSPFEVPGFFVQGDSVGPALFVGADPDLGGARLSVGDRVSFRILDMDNIYGLPMASFIDSVVIHSRNNDRSAMLQGVTSASELSNNSYLYAAELVSASLSIQSNITPDNEGFVTAQIAINGGSDERLRLRMPVALQEELGFEPGCSMILKAAPVWLYYGETRLLAYALDDFDNMDCPPPVVTSVTVDGNAELRIELSRTLDAASVESNGSQFTFDGDLTATAAVVSGRVVTVTTTPQSGALYTMTMAQSLRDVFGKGAAAGNSFTFEGGSAPAVAVRINEVKSNIAPGCDLLELRVIEAGNMAGFSVRSQSTTVLTFSSLSVRRNDLVVVHFDSTDGGCRRADSVNETQAPDQQPRSAYPANFDTAYDWYTFNQGPAAEPGVLAVRDDQDRIIDAVLVTDNASEVNSLTENVAALVAMAGEWQTQSGNVPPGGFVDAAFHDNAATGIDADPVNVSPGFDRLDGARSVQRNGNADNDHAGDWSAVVHTFGLPNVGQTPL